MSNLQDQLLKAGLVSKKKAKQVNKEKTKKAKVQRKSAQPQVNETQERARQALTEKAEKDRVLNASRDAEAEVKAIAAQIKQLITLNRIRRSGDVAYNFTDGPKVKKVYINDKLQLELSRGQLAIVRLGDGYELVPAVVAEKIALRDESIIVSKADKVDEVKAEDDPYADYEIPDDLMW